MTDITGGVANPKEVDVEELTCPACSNPVPKGRTRWCSNECCRQGSSNEQQGKPLDWKPKPSQHRTHCLGCGVPVEKSKQGLPRKWCTQACMNWARHNPGKLRPTKRECGHCGKDISHRAMNAKWCSTDCCDFGLGRRLEPAARHRECVTCSKPFVGQNGKQRFCSPTPEQRARGNKQSRCARTYDKNLERERGPQHQLDCHWCGVTFKGWTQTKDAGHKNRYCSRNCSEQSVSFQLLRATSCSVSTSCEVHSTPCRNTDCWYCRPRPTGPTCKVKRKPTRLLFVSGPCAVCGEQFTGYTFNLDHPPAYCSMTCVRQQTRNRWGRLDTYRQRARHHGVGYVPISRPSIFRRDGYRCGICGEQTDPDALVPDHRAPTIDHIIPMSLGGPHVASNLQCACFICNTRKGAALQPVGATDEPLQVSFC